MKRPNPFAKKNKFSAEPQVCAGGHKHASRREARRCDQLRLLERAGQITHLVQQPFFPFVINGDPLHHENGRRVGVTLDFQYFEGGKNVAEDAKPKDPEARGRDWPLRKAIFRALYPHVELREV